MTERGKIICIYTVVAIFSVATLAISLSIANNRKERFGEQAIVDAGKEEPEILLTLEADLVATNQDGEEVSLSQLKDKVWIASQFFANCPKCLTRNSGDLRKLYEEFRSNPDFHVVSISVNPDDNPGHLKEYAEAIGAESKNWWFLSGPQEKLNEFMEKEMKFMKVVENKEADATMRFSHDLGFEIYDRGMNLVKKRDLFYARGQSDRLHKFYYEEVQTKIRTSLESKAGAQPES